MVQIIKQELINNLQDIDTLSSRAAHSFVKNIANDEFNEDDRKRLITLLDELKEKLSKARAAAIYIH